VLSDLPKLNGWFCLCGRENRVLLLDTPLQGLFLMSQQVHGQIPLAHTGWISMNGQFQDVVVSADFVHKRRPKSSAFKFGFFKGEYPL
jgi:hypothetical protein